MNVLNRCATNLPRDLGNNLNLRGFPKQYLDKETASIWPSILSFGLSSFVLFASIVASIPEVSILLTTTI